MLITSLPVPEPLVLLAVGSLVQLLTLILLLMAMWRQGRAQAALDMVQQEHRALLLHFHEMISDLDRAARAPSAPPQGPLQVRVEDAIARAPDMVDAQELARLSGVSLNVARTVMAFHGKRRRMASRH